MDVEDFRALRQQVAEMAQELRRLRTEVERITTLAQSPPPAVIDEKRSHRPYDPNKKWLTVRDLRARGLPTGTTIYRWYTQADFPKPLYMGSLKVWDRAAIEAWEASHIRSKQTDASFVEEERASVSLNKGGGQTVTSPPPREENQRGK